MGGEVLDYPAKRILNRGIEKGMEKGVEEGIKVFILDNIEENIPRERIIEKLQRRFDLTEEQALEKYEKYGGWLADKVIRTINMLKLKWATIHEGI